MAWEEVSIQGKTLLHSVDKSLRQHNDTVYWSISTRGCGCASLEHSWQHRGDVSEWLMQKTEPLLKFGAHSGQFRHSLSGGVMLKAQQKGRLCSW